MKNLNENKFLTALDNYPVHAGDKVYDFKNKHLFTVKDINYDSFKQVYFEVEETDKVISIGWCCIPYDFNHLSEGIHIDDYIDKPTYSIENEDMVNYTKFFFLLHRWPAYMKMQFDEWIKEYKLFCVYKGKKYRVTGCSRMGDIWLNKNHKEEHGYTHRVMINQVTDFTRE